MDELTNMKEKKKRRMSKKDWVLIVVILCVAGLSLIHIYKRRDVLWIMQKNH